MENEKNLQKRVVVGGTFDSFHKGHEHLLGKASSLGEVKIGLTSDRMAKENKGVEVEPFEERKNHLLDFLPNAQVEKIDDPIGFALYEDFDCIVVSNETRLRADKINDERENINKKKMEVVEVDFYLAQDGKPISSTRIREGEIDREGKLIEG